MHPNLAYVAISGETDTGRTSRKSYLGLLYYKYVSTMIEQIFLGPSVKTEQRTLHFVQNLAVLLPCTLKLGVKLYLYHDPLALK